MITIIKNIIKKTEALYFWFINSIVFLIHRVDFQRSIQVVGFLRIKNLGKIIIGNNNVFYSSISSNPVDHASCCYFTTTRNGTIKIGNNCGISNSILFSMINITIGDNVKIGSGCKIYDTDFHSVILEDRLNNNINIKMSPVSIQDGAWLGGNVTILKGVVVGENSVIGSGSIVTRNVPPNQIWAGNPAKFIRTIN